MSLELGEKIQNEKRIEQNKNELITNVSHDLKTPLTSIVGYLDLLNNKDIDEKTRDEYIKIAYNKSLRLKTLVNELFEYTKLTSNDIKLEKNKVNIAMLLNQVVGESIINFTYKDIEVVLKEGSGLGLAIVKRIVELHEGSITVEKVEDNIKFNIVLNEA